MFVEYVRLGHTDGTLRSREVMGSVRKLNEVKYQKSTYGRRRWEGPLVYPGYNRGCVYLKSPVPPLLKCRRVIGKDNPENGRRESSPKSQTSDPIPNHPSFLRRRIETSHKMNQTNPSERTCWDGPFHRTLYGVHFKLFTSPYSLVPGNDLLTSKLESYRELVIEDLCGHVPVPPPS